MIAPAAVFGAVLAVLWGIHHPLPGITAAVALVLLAAGVIRFCREIAPALAVRSWTAPARRRACPACGWGFA